MSSGNKLSISICDDNGNLSYQKQYRVRRIIQRGVIDDEQGVSLDMEALGYEQDKNDGWVIDEDKTTGKFLLVAEYDSSIYDETDFGLMVPMTQTNGDGNSAEFVFDNKMLYAGNNFNDNYFFALSSGAGDEWIDGDKFCLEIIKADLLNSESEALKFDSIMIHNGIISAKKDVSDQTETVKYLRTAAAMVKSFKGRRWFCVTPLIINENFGCQIFFRRKINGGLIRYFVVEVEE
jgi:hypothetical protein